MAYAIINGMTLTLDKAGRIVLPKPVRDRFRLHAGSDLQLELSAEGILLRPLERRASLIQKEGLLLHCGEALNRFAWDRLVEDHREERIQELTGL